MEPIYPPDQGDLFGREQLAQGRLLAVPASVPETSLGPRCPVCSGVGCRCQVEGHTAPELGAETSCDECGDPIGDEDPHTPEGLTVHARCCPVCCGLCHSPVEDFEGIVRDGVLYHAECRDELDADIAAGVS